MSVGAAICEVQYKSAAVFRCTDTESPEQALASPGKYDLSCSTPAPTLVWETGCSNMLGFGNDNEASPHRRVILLPGAWAIGEGVLLELDETEGRGSPGFSIGGSPDSLHDSFSRMAGTLTATMGSYLSNLANVIASCALSATTDVRSGSNCASPRSTPSLQHSRPCSSEMLPPPAPLPYAGFQESSSHASKKED